MQPAEEPDWGWSSFVPQSLLWPPKGENRSPHKYQALPETAGPPDLQQREADRTGMHYPDDPHQDSSECKRSPVSGTEEEDAVWCEVFGKRKWPLLAPRWACVGLHSSSSHQPWQKQAIWWLESMRCSLSHWTAERIQVIHLNSKTVYVLLKFIPETRDIPSVI